MKRIPSEHTLEFLLDFDGRVLAKRGISSEVVRVEERRRKR